MTPAARVTYLAALLIGVAIGGFFGFRYTISVLDSYYNARRITAPFALRDFSLAQYKYADPANAKVALESFTTLLEEMEQMKPENGQKFDLALSYTRLALLEDATNNPEQSRVYMTKAQSWCKASRGRECSASEMKSALKIFDERIP